MTDPLGFFWQYQLQLQTINQVTVARSKLASAAMLRHLFTEQRFFLCVFKLEDDYAANRK